MSKPKSCYQQGVSEYYRQRAVRARYNSSPRYKCPYPEASPERSEFDRGYAETLDKATRPPSSKEWTAEDAGRFNKKTRDDPYLQDVWAASANRSQRQHNDEGKAVRAGNAAVKREVEEEEAYEEGPAWYGGGPCWKDNDPIKVEVKNLQVYMGEGEFHPMET